jgi:predicted nuclease of predicted toxin-antitoxin system
MARLFADEDFPYPAVQALRSLGHDALTVKDLGKANQEWPDEAVLLYAITDDRVLLTLNRRHFRRLHEVYPNHPGIIACTFNPHFGGLARNIHEALIKAGNCTGKFICVYRGGLGVD